MTPPKSPPHDIDLDATFGDADCEARDRESVGVLRAKARADVEPPAMCATREDRTVQHALAQGIAGMGAAVFQRVDLAVDPKQAHVDAVDLNAEPTAVRYVIDSSNPSIHLASLRLARVPPEREEHTGRGLARPRRECGTPVFQRPCTR